MYPISSFSGHVRTLCSTKTLHLSSRSTSTTALQSVQNLQHGIKLLSRWYPRGHQECKGCSPQSSFDSAMSLRLPLGPSSCDHEHSQWHESPDYARRAQGDIRNSMYAFFSSTYISDNHRYAHTTQHHVKQAKGGLVPQTVRVIPQSWCCPKSTLVIKTNYQQTASS